MLNVNQLCGFGAGGPTASYWASILSASGYDYGYDAAVDEADGKLAYVVGLVDSDAKAFIAQVDMDGVLQWQKTLDETFTPEEPTGTMSASANGNYVYMTYHNAGGHTILAQYNKSGTLNWHKYSTNIRQYKSVCDSGGNLYVAATDVSTSALGSILKFDNTGAISWQRKLTVASQFVQLLDVAVDSSGNVFVVGFRTGTNDEIVVAKFNSSGTIQWQRKLSKTSTNLRGYSITISTAGDVYILGTLGTGAWLVAKYNTSGTIQWQREMTITGATSGIYSARISAASDGLLIGIGYAGGSVWVVAKYDFSGGLSFGRQFTYSATGAYCVGWGLMAYGGFYVMAGDVYTTADSHQLAMAKMPADGTQTKTAGNWTYASYSITEQAGTATDAAGNTTDASGSLTVGAGFLTGATPAYTLTTTKF